MRLRVFYLVLIALMLFGLILSGCSENPQTEPKTGGEPGAGQPQEPIGGAPAVALGDYFPASVGSSWEYQGEGNEYASFKRRVDFNKENRAQFSEDNGGTVSVSVFEITDSAVTRVFFQGEAYDRKNRLEEAGNDQTVVLKTPLAVGTKWKQTPDADREIVEVNAAISTPAGAFDNCIKVRTTNPQSTIYEYYQKGVGLVKREFTSGDSKVTSSLSKYEIK